MNNAMIVRSYDMEKLLTNKNPGHQTWKAGKISIIVRSYDFAIPLYKKGQCSLNFERQQNQ